jgi:hypothetical protein
MAVQPDPALTFPPGSPGAAAALAQGPPPPAPPVARKPKTPKDRLERYEAVRPDGTVVTVEHNLDKGTTEIVSAAK